MVNDFRRMHKSITPERVVRAVERYETTLDTPGFCINCGAEATGIDPDARNYPCEHCGRRKVFGACELMMNMVF